MITYAFAAVLATLTAVRIARVAVGAIPERPRFLIRLALRRAYLAGALALAGCGLGATMGDSGGSGGGGGGSSDAGADTADGNPCADGAPGSEATLGPNGDCLYYCPMPTPPWGTRLDKCTDKGANIYVCLPGYSACGADAQTDGCNHPLSSNFDCGACGVKCMAPSSCMGTVATGFSCQTPNGG